MQILEINTVNYRNLEIKKQNFCSGVNFIFGQNAQGKTNLIESIWMLTGARSFRGTKDADLIKFGKDFASIKAKIFAGRREQEIRINFAEGKRKAFLNGAAQRYPTEIIGTLRTVLFSPINLSLAGGGPEKRRRFLDAAICQLKPTYTALLIRYNQTLKQRNSFLKSHPEKNIDFLEVLDINLSALASEIMKNRLEYMIWLNDEATKIYSDISMNREVFEIKYISKIMNSSEFTAEEFEKIMIEKLQKSRETDFKFKFTSFGPHKDDIELCIDKKAVKSFGSQGQQRSAVLSLKLAEAEILNKKFYDPPVVLLDDVMSELDDLRKSYIVGKMKNYQVFVTGCDKTALGMMKSGQAYEIDSGKVVCFKDF